MTKIKVKEKDKSNLSSLFDKDEIKNIGFNGFDSYSEDDESRSEWKDKHKEYLEIYNQLETYKNNYGDSFTGSEGRIPLLTEACLGFQARAYKAIFPQRSFVATASEQDITPDEVARSERVAKWMNYYLNFRHKRYKRDKKRMLLASSLMGSDFSKTYLDPVLKVPTIERVRAQDLVISYGKGPRELEDVYRKTQIITIDSNKAAKLYQSGFFTKMPQTSNDYLKETDGFTSVENEAEGVTMVSDDEKAVYILEQHTYYDLDGDGIEEPVIIWIDEQSKEVLRVEARYDINDEDRKPNELFTHYSFIDNPNGFYGHGYGHLIANLNVSLNQMFRNSVDAGELANAGNMGGFISESTGIKGGEIEFPIGKFHKVPRSVSDLRNSIYQMQFPGPNAAYGSQIEFLQGVIQRLANTTEAVSGDVSKVYQPMTILTMLEQSLQLPTSIMENIALSMEDELDKIFKVAGKNPKELETFMLEDERVSISADDFRGATRVYPIMDPRSITKQQKMAKAQSIYQIGTTNPLIANDPDSLYTITKQVLESMEAENIDEIIKKPQSQEPESIDNQYKENMLLMLPPGERPLFDVFPEHQHQQHIQIIDELIRGFTEQEETTGKKDITDESLEAIMVHRQKHIAYLYGQKTGVIENGQGQLGAMDEATGDEALLAALANELSMGGEPIGLPTGESGTVPGTGGGFEGSGEIYGEGLLRRVPLDERG